jgi:REP element-mobilizing transposase RayT
MPDPLAYFLTWPTYGTWLPGDERGWVKHQSGWQSPDPVEKLEAEARMTEEACILDQEQRQVVERTIADHCRIRGWELYAVNCRTNHLHIVVATSRDPDEVREQFKAWCTRKLKELEHTRKLTRRASEGTSESYPENGVVVDEPIRQNWWAERGSCRWIGDEESLDAAIRYVLDGQ